MIVNEESQYEFALLGVPSEHLADPPGRYNQDKDFTSLKAWQNCREVKLFFYNKVLPKLPVEEKYGLDSQIRRAAISATANIAEGYGRYHYQEGIQFYRISRGSLYELKDHLISCCDLAYVTNALRKEGTTLLEEAKKSLNGYIKFVTRQIRKKSNTGIRE